MWRHLRAHTLHREEVALMRLSELLRAFPFEVRGAGDPEIRGVTHDSRTVEPGELYAALVGQRFDGRTFAADAVARGAVAVAGPLPENGPPAGLRVPWVVVDDPRAILGPFA